MILLLSNAFPKEGKFLKGPERTSDKVFVEYVLSCRESISKHVDNKWEATMDRYEQ